MSAPAPKKTAPRKAAPRKAAPKKVVGADVDDGAARLAAVPDSLRFTSAGVSKTPEKVDVAIDGHLFTITEPSRAFLNLVVPATLMNPQATEADLIRTMFDIVRTCLDPIGVSYLDAQIRNPRAGFDDELLGLLVKFILDRWTPDLAKRVADAR